MVANCDGGEIVESPLFGNCDVVAEVFTFLLTKDQTALRAVNRSTIAAFNHAVQLGFLNSGIAAHDPSERPLENQDVRWFPAIRHPSGDELHVKVQRASSGSGSLTCTVTQMSYHSDRAIWVARLSRSSQSLAVAGRYDVVLPGGDCLVSSLELSDVDELAFLHDYVRKYPTLGCLRIMNLPKLIAIDKNFCARNDRLEVLELANLPQLVIIDDSFLARHSTLFNYSAGKRSGMCQVSLINLPKLEIIGPHFVRECPFISSIKLTGLLQLKTIPPCFLRGCAHLREISFVNLPELATIGGWFAYECYSLVTMNLSNLPALTTIESYFMGACYALQFLTLSDMLKLEEIGQRFTDACYLLQVLALARLPALARMPEVFESVRRLSLVDLPKIEALNIFGTTSKLEVVELRRLSALKCISEKEGKGSMLLRRLVLECLPNFESIDGFYLQLSEVEVKDVPKLRNMELLQLCGDGWLMHVAGKHRHS